MLARNEQVYMTRRYPPLREKQKLRDSKIAKALVTAWDIEHNPNKVLAIFEKEHTMLSDPRYWELLKTVWILCGTTALAEKFRNFMRSNRGYKSYFMTPEEKAHLDNLPDKLTLYRAHNAGDIGLSYSTSISYAREFALTYKKEQISTIEIDKSKVFAYLNRNKEDEIIIL